jgi:four helix bundle protein
MARTHWDLEVWAAALGLAELVYVETRGFPATERFGLAAQMRRAAVSVISNIAEGAARDSTREFARYVSIARGSLAELEAQVALAARLGIVSDVVFNEQLRRTGQLLSALHRTLRGNLVRRRGAK